MSSLRSRIWIAAGSALACASVALAIAFATAATSSAATTPPNVTSAPPTQTGRSTETLNGSVDPNGQDTTYYFQYGRSVGYGARTPNTDAGAGTNLVPAGAELTGLIPNALYHYRLVAINASGTTYGSDETFTAGESQVRVLGREGFVSPGNVIGLELGCFAGENTCSGSYTVTHDGTVVGQHDYSIPPDTGGFQNFHLTSAGEHLLMQNSTYNLLPVLVTIHDASGQTFSFTVHLARWIWTDK